MNTILPNLSSRQPLSLEEKIERWKVSCESQPDNDGYVNFGEVARMLLGLSCQYAIRHVDNSFAEDYPWLGNGLRFTGRFANYHNVRIHVDDVLVFVCRYRTITQASVPLSWSEVSKGEDCIGLRRKSGC